MEAKDGGEGATEDDKGDGKEVGGRTLTFSSDAATGAMTSFLRFFLTATPPLPSRVVGRVDETAGPCMASWDVGRVPWATPAPRPRKLALALMLEPRPTFAPTLTLAPRAAMPTLRDRRSEDCNTGAVRRCVALEAFVLDDGTMLLLLLVPRDVIHGCLPYGMSAAMLVCSTAPCIGAMKAGSDCGADGLVALSSWKGCVKAVSEAPADGAAMLLVDAVAVALAGVDGTGRVQDGPADVGAVALGATMLAPWAVLAVPKEKGAVVGAPGTADVLLLGAKEKDGAVVLVEAGVAKEKAGVLEVVGAGALEPLVETPGAAGVPKEKVGAEGTVGPWPVPGGATLPKLKGVVVVVVVALVVELAG